jgi:hypothetical protein
MKLIIVFILSLCTFDATATIIEMSGSGAFTDFSDLNKDQVILLDEAFSFSMVFNMRNIERLNSADSNLSDPNLQVSVFFSSDISGSHEPTIGHLAIHSNTLIEPYFLDDFPDYVNYKLVSYMMEIRPLADYRRDYLSPSNLATISALSNTPRQSHPHHR